MQNIFRGIRLVIVIAVAATLCLPTIASAELVRKVDNFIVFLDQSGSMIPEGYRTGHEKFDQAVGLVKRFDSTVPDIGFESGVALFAPYKVVKQKYAFKPGEVGPYVDKIILPLSELTAMGEAFSAVDSFVGKFSGKTALIVYTDGEQNTGVSPLVEAKKLYSKYGKDLCIHFVSFADTPHGEQVIKDIAALSDCSVVVDAASLASDDAIADFANAILYDEKAPAPAPKAAPAPAPAPVVAKEVITFNLLFDFDQAEIKDEMIPTLEQAKLILEEDPEATFVLSGHTDSSGPEAYNQGLSERRATAVKTWLVNHGVAANKLQTVGYGETRPKYDNGTREGRKLNRRVEMQSK